MRERSPHKRDSPFFRESPVSRRDSPHSRSGSSVSSRSYSPERSKAYPFHQSQHSRSMSSLHKRNISSQQGNAGLMMRTGSWGETSTHYTTFLFTYALLQWENETSCTNYLSALQLLHCTVCSSMYFMRGIVGVISTAPPDWLQNSQLCSFSQFSLLFSFSHQLLLLLLKYFSGFP